MFRFLFFWMCTSVSYANEPLVFKPASSLQYDWVTYSLALVLLVAIALIYYKKNSARFSQPSTLTLVEKKQLGNKTVVYIVHYKQQQFILADNQQALALQPLISEANNEQM